MKRLDTIKFTVRLPFNEGLVRNNVVLAGDRLVARGKDSKRRKVLKANAFAVVEDRFMALADRSLKADRNAARRAAARAKHMS